MNLWIVGKFVGETNPGESCGWEFCGVFDSEELAVSQCHSREFFVGPATLNNPIADTKLDWEGLRWPVIEKEDQ